MNELNRIVIELIQITEEIKRLNARKKELETQIKVQYAHIQEICGATGKTIDEI